MRLIGKTKAQVAQSSSQDCRFPCPFSNNNRIWMNIPRFVLAEGEAL